MFVVQFYNTSESKILHIETAAMAIINRKTHRGEDKEPSGTGQERVSPYQRVYVPSIRHVFTRSYESMEGGHC